MFLLYLGLLWLNAAATYTLLGRRNPELVAERMRLPADREPCP